MDSGRTRRRRFDVFGTPANFTNAPNTVRTESRSSSVPRYGAMRIRVEMADEIGCRVGLRLNANIVVVSVAADRQRPRQIV
jgi:hypothetical protein